VRDYGEIRAILPHGAAMVLVDRVEWLEPGQALRAVKAISGGEPCYRGLPAGLPRGSYAYPVSLLIESFGQAAAVLWHSRHGGLADTGNLVMFAAARDCRFHGQAYPGDLLRHEVRLESAIVNTGFATGETWVGDRRIATMGSFIAAIRPATLLPTGDRAA
jgi:3-hydroxyacyl-[acyl-carrier-protein] dehydratase